MNINTQGEGDSLLGSKSFKFTQDDAKRLSKQFLLTLFPIITWLPKYKYQYIKGDVLAGITVAVTLIPQGIAYALVAGVPPIYGLYSSVVPVLMYVFLGTSPHLSVGPFAVISLLVKEAVQSAMRTLNQDITDMNLYMQHVFTLTLMVGLVQTIFGFCRLGFVSNYLSDPVRNGFNSASAITIMLSQIPNVFGLNVPDTNFELYILVEVVDRLKNTNLFSLLFAGVGIVVLLGIKKLNQRFKKVQVPGALVVVVVATIFSWAFNMQNSVGLPVVGEVPQGLPSVDIPDVTIHHVIVLLPGTIMIAVVGYMSNIAIAIKFAESHGYPIDANQELVAFGLSGIVSAFFSCYPSSASLSRTAINDSAGAKTHMAGFVNGFLISMTLLFLTPLVQPLPKAALAAVVLVAVYPLVEVHVIKPLWKEKKRDLAVMIITFICTIFIGILPGLLIGMGLSILILTYKNSYPDIEILGNIPDSTTYKPQKVYKHVICHPTIVVLTVGGSLNFTNILYLKNKIEDVSKTKEDLKAIIVDCSSIYDVDSSAIRILKDVISQLHKRKLVLCLCNLTQNAYNTLTISGTISEKYIPVEKIYDTVHEAVTDIRNRLNTVVNCNIP